MSKTDERLEINIPFFSGFYESELSGLIDRHVEMFPEDEAEREGKHPPELQLDESELSDIWEYIDYGAAYNAIARDYADMLNVAIEDETGFNPQFEFVEMTSPKFYNFETDKLFVKAPRATIARMIRDCRKDRYATLAAAVERRHTSRDGFISFYNNNVGAWLGKAVRDWDYHELGTLLCAWLAVHNVDTRELQWRVYELLADDDYAYFADNVDWQKWSEHVEDLREEKRRELLARDPDYVIPAPRCPDTIDMFTGRAG